MSVCAVASLRPLGRQCLRQPPAYGLLSLRIQSRSTNLNIRTIVPLLGSQHRFQSGFSDKETGKDENDPKQDVKTGSKPTFRQFMGRSLIASLRNLAYAMSPKGIQQGLKESPVLTSMIMGL